MPLVGWCLRAFAASRTVGRAVIAAPPGRERELAGLIPVGLEAEIVAGGDSRSESVAAALARAEAEIVAVHDAARPLVSAELIDGLVARLAGIPDAAGVIAATPLRDTVKRVGEVGGEIVATEPRERLWAAQTPQVFRAEQLRAALDAPPERLAAATDESMLVEAAGGRVLIEPSPAENIKVTTPADLARVEALLLARA